MKNKKMLFMTICISILITACSEYGNALSTNELNYGDTGDSAYTEEMSLGQHTTSFSNSVKPIPDSYFTEIERSGNVVRLDYETMTYDEKNEPLSKYAYVYLPYGYNGEKQYNVFYLLHGGGGNAERYFDGESQSSEFKRILDHMIAEGELEPLIVVTPTFYPTGNTDNSVSNAGEQTANFHYELVNDLIPAVETTYSTFAASTDAPGLQASREHRAFGGFSMGSVATWYTFTNCLDYFKYYMPMSGDSWVIEQLGGNTSPTETAAYLDRIVKESGYGAEDYFIYALTGTADTAFDAMQNQIDAMKNFPDSFQFISEASGGNIYFQIKDGGTHDYTNIRQYIYNALPSFWSLGESRSQGAEALAFAYTTQELYTYHDNKQLYGVVYIPQGINEPMPAVIYAHGFGGTHQSGAQYAEAMAKNGYVAYSFDFGGGSTSSRSDGTPLEMSIFTEQADLEAVINMVQELDYVDANNIFLLGSSQGGAVSAITAADNMEQVQGAILLYPAFVLVDTANELFNSVDEIPDTHHLMWMTVGRTYFEQLLDYDIYEHIATYDKDILIIHGDADSIVPLSYSERALEVYNSARLEVLQGAGHGFRGEDAQQTIKFILEYIEAHQS